MKHLLALLLLVATPAQADSNRVKLSPSAGTWHVPVEVDGALTAQFMVDSGAAPVLLTADMYARLRALGAIADTDLRPPQTFTLADGSQHQWPTFMLRSLKVGGVTIENVHAAAKPTSSGSALLGQAFLERLQAWHFDNGTHELVLEPRDLPRAVAAAPPVAPPTVDIPPWVGRTVATERVVDRQPLEWLPPTFQVRFGPGARLK
jgi:clan AA aspartic protease (TIGR02281 family)